MSIPINNYFVGRKLREISSYNNANIELTDNAIPSFILNPSNGGVEVQPAFPKPNANQRLRYKFVNWTTSTTQYQIATPTANMNIYYVGSYAITTAATAASPAIWDGTSGGTPASSANTAYDELMIEYFYLPGTVGAERYHMPPMPLKIVSGLRAEAGVASGSGFLIIWYIEEVVYAP